jgi:hypothetical protein
MERLESIRFFRSQPWWNAFVGSSKQFSDGGFAHAGGVHKTVKPEGFCRGRTTRLVVEEASFGSNFTNGLSTISVNGFE